MAKTVTVGCKLPNGLILEVEKVQIRLNGKNSPTAVDGCGITILSDEFWQAWRKNTPDFQPLISGALFVVPDLKDATMEAAARANTKTGFEGLDQKSPVAGITAKKDD